MSDVWVFVAIGLLSGVAAGLFGVGGGIVIVPALVYWAEFSQRDRDEPRRPTPADRPDGDARVLPHGNVDLRAALIIAGALVLGSYGGAWLANRAQGPHLRLAFGLFLMGIGLSLVHSAGRRLGWI
jgi:uncharacterized membrane protein YfcA